MAKTYRKPQICFNSDESQQAVPLIAPLAFFSAASAAALVGGTVVGAAAAKKALKVSPNEQKCSSLAPVLG